MVQQKSPKSSLKWHGISKITQKVPENGIEGPRYNKNLLPQSSVVKLYFFLCFPWDLTHQVRKTTPAPPGLVGDLSSGSPCGAHTPSHHGGRVFFQTPGAFTVALLGAWFARSLWRKDQEMISKLRLKLFQPHA